MAINCPACGGDTKVINTRGHHRQRMCLADEDHKFWTAEVILSKQPVILATPLAKAMRKAKRDGTKPPAAKTSVPKPRSRASVQAQALTPQQKQMQTVVAEYRAAVEAGALEEPKPGSSAAARAARHRIEDLKSDKRYEDSWFE